MQLEDIWEKVANNARLTSEELAFLKRSARETQLRNAFVAGNTSAENKLNIQFPFSPIYSEVVHKNVASIDVNIPLDFKHLILIGAGKSTSVSADVVLARFNGDSGNNYSRQYMQMADTTVSGGQQLTLSSAVLGDFMDTADDTLAASFFTIIPHYRSSYYKTTMTLTNFRNASFRYVKLSNSFWNNASAISKITLFTNDNIQAGSLFSIYGIQ